MSTKKQYTDAQKIAYYRKKAKRTGNTPAYKSKQYYKYKAGKDAAQATERARRIADRKTPGYISAGGEMLGNLIHPVAGFLGGKLGHLVEQVTGFGDYKVTSNSILKGGLGPPQIVNSINRGEVIIRHREYIGDIVASQAFNVQSFLINPGLSQTFPWLSQMAGSYEQYKLRGVLFEFNSTSSDALLSTATSTALGTVIMSTDYDVADSPPSDKRQMLNSEWSSSSKPSCTFIHPIECKKSLTAQNVLYTRTALAVPAGFDQRLYDFARFNIATEGMQANGGVLGELWVTYEISFMKQQLNYSGQADHFRLTGSTGGAPLSLGVRSSIVAGGTLGGVINGLGTAYSFPPQLGSGKFLLNYVVSGTSAVVNYVNLVFTNCIGLGYWINDTNAQVSPTPGTNSVQMINVTVQILRQGAAVTWPTTTTLPGTPNNGDLWVVRIPDSIVQYPV